MGVLLNCEDHWEKRIRIVESMKFIQTKPCADLLFSELRRVKSSNTTRRYLGAVIKVLSDMPSELIEDGSRGSSSDWSPCFMRCVLYSAGGSIFARKRFPCGFRASG